jgi:SAM-dependent methyltransferase
MQQSSKRVLTAWLADKSIQSVLDAPSGDGWLGKALGPQVVMDGIDLYEDSKQGYRHFWRHDLDRGLPVEAGEYDLVAICEGIEHVGNPLLLLRDAHAHLKPGAILAVTTPSVWYPQSRLQYLYKGFFPSFPPLAGKVVPGTHMHITPWCYPWLWTYLKLAGFEKIELLPEPELTGKHLHERILAWPSRLWCKRKLAKSRSEEETEYWKNCATDAALLGRHLILVARKPALASE